MDPPVPDSEDADLTEALRRSLVEKTREEALLADVLRASVMSHDEDIARAMQAQFDLEDRETGAPINRRMRGAAAVRDTLDNDTVEGPWLVARSRGRGISVKPSQSVNATTNHPQQSWRAVAAAQTPSSHSTVPPIKGAASTSSSQQTPTTALDSPVTPEGGVITTRKPSVVLDGLNVGCSLIGGGGHRFRARGVYLALEYYRARKVPALALLPANKVDSNLGSYALADDVPLLLKLHEQQRVFFTPPGAHDDNFLLTYAMSVGADLVSNDRFRDELYRQRGSEASKRLKTFLRMHLVPFTFVLEEFVPNPHPESLAKHLHHPRDRGYR